MSTGIGVIAYLSFCLVFALQTSWIFPQGIELDRLRELPPKLISQHEAPFSKLVDKSLCICGSLKHYINDLNQFQERVNVSDVLSIVQLKTCGGIYVFDSPCNLHSALGCA